LIDFNKLNKKHILILRPDNIGDVILFSGTLKHFRAFFKNDHLVLAVQKHIVNLVELCPHVDEVISVDSLNYFKEYKESRNSKVNRVKYYLKSFVRKGRKSVQFDQIIYPLRSPQVWHLELIRFLRVKEVSGIIGCDVNLRKYKFKKELKPEVLFKTKLNITGLDPWRHELLTTFDFLNNLGMSIPSIDFIVPEFWLSQDEVDPLEKLKSSKRQIIGLFPGAQATYRQWDQKNYSILFERINIPVDFVIFGSASERDLALQIEKSYKKKDGGTILNLVGKTTLRELIKGIKSCDLFIGMETAGLHIAIANGVKTIGIVGGGHFDRFVPWGDQEKNTILTKRLDCFHCNWSCKYDQIECLQGVMPNEVADVSINLLR